MSYLKRRQRANKRFALRVVSERVAERGLECGDCQACCEVIGVNDLKKPYNQRCEHQCDQGCNIYESKPRSCTGFYCGWRAMKSYPVGVEYRPDKSGVLVYQDVNLRGQPLIVIA
jgi:hypothetical protein